LDLRADFAHRVTTLLLLDVLEHLESPAAFLDECLARFPRCRRVLITLPGRMELWSNYDTYYGHFLRYDRRTAARLLPAGGWQMRGCGYFFHGLYCPGLLLK